MNEKSVTREVVVDLLKKRGVDLENNRFLILQFEVEQIARMKPKAKTENETGLLEYLEDIIGTNQYVEPIEVTFKELEVLNDERTSRLTRLKQVQGEKQGLEEIKNEAETCLELESSVIDKY
jgi:structural maintenance of chromosome 4